MERQRAPPKGREAENGSRGIDSRGRIPERLRRCNGRYANGLTLEVNRLCTDGTRNACSFLYSAAWRAARNLGYKKLITYILVSETGSSLKAAGWKCVGECGGKRWNGRSAPKVDLYPAQMKLRFEVEKGGE